MSHRPVVVPVVLCGGEGKRLWPLSRKSLPKQFLYLMDEERSLLQQTAMRLENVKKSEKLKNFHFEDPIFVCNQLHAFVVTQQLLELQGSKEGGATVLVEPSRRDSAPGIAAAALVAQEKYPDSILLILPSDAFIKEDEAWEKAIFRACAAANAGYLTVFGITPTHPETGYGYIEVGKAIKDFSNTHCLSHFVEKPSFETAKKYLESGKYLWNSGMFISKASVLLEDFKKFQPEILEAVQKAVKKRRFSSEFEILDKEAFESSPSISIDFAIAEHTKQGAVVEADFTWSDIGSWHSLWENSEQDQWGSVKKGHAFLSETKNCYVRSQGPLIITHDVENLAIVATNDAVLVSSLKRSQEIKDCVASIEKAGQKEACESLTTRRPWGKYTILMHADGYMVKEISVLPGQRLSLQKHFHRSEHWVVVSGTAIATCGDEVKELHENEGIYIPRETVHRLENRGTENLILIETQYGAPLLETDIVRLEDDYRRA
ncbi:mannose-1-phosphate guanylyltransferase/mannose-6-phosphate isomerase [Acetobacteraceae bacterium]|nr:mannose-1-phosphate guanylyltransferase/mannose-6-phosphate isomerase [Acetobacteraceae bacterium]